MKILTLQTDFYAMCLYVKQHFLFKIINNTLNKSKFYSPSSIDPSNPTPTK